MSLGRILGGIVGVVSKIASVAWSVINVAKPILEAMRPSVPAIDEAFDFIEAKVAEGGVAADNFLDENIGTIRDIRSAGSKGVVAMSTLVDVCDDLERYSQVETPDTITADEAVAIGEKLWSLRRLLNEYGDQVDKALAKLPS